MPSGGWLAYFRVRAADSRLTTSEHVLGYYGRVDNWTAFGLSLRSADRPAPAGHVEFSLMPTTGRPTRTRSSAPAYVKNAQWQRAHVACKLGRIAGGPWKPRPPCSAARSGRCTRYSFPPPCVVQRETILAARSFCWACYAHAANGLARAWPWPLADSAVDCQMHLVGCVVQKRTEYCCRYWCWLRNRAACARASIVIRAQGAGSSLYLEDADAADRAARRLRSEDAWLAD